MTSSNFFDVIVFFFSSLDSDPGFMSIPLLAVMTTFIYKEFDQKPGKWKDRHLNFVQYPRTGASLEC